MKKAYSIAALLLICFLLLPLGASAEGTAGWRENEYGRWWVDTDGTYPTSTWRTIEGARYWFDENGYAATGWRELKSGTYYFSATGQMQTGWVLSEGDWYWMHTDGKMLTGWQKCEGQWYYFSPSGKWNPDNSVVQNTIMGIDVSKWQEEIDWQAVKDFGVEFAFIRLGYGAGNLDGYFEKNMEQAEQVGIPVGVYYYCMARNEAEAVRDARFVIENLSGKLVSYPVAIDLEDKSQEDLSKEQLGEIARAFCDEIAAAGYTPMLYCNEYWYKEKIDVSLVADVEKWIARYNAVYDTNVQRGIWQASESSRVEGVQWNADVNFAFRDYTQIVTPRRGPVEGYYETKGRWVPEESRWRFRYHDGSFAAGCWETVDGQDYWFDRDGYMVTGWIWDGSHYYFADEYGRTITGWLYRSGCWYYLGPEGKMVTHWQQIDGLWYFFSPGGNMITGWIWDGSHYYFADEYGRTIIGWLLDGGKWYYLDAGGKMVTGWRQLDGSWFYFHSGGNMATGWLRLGDTWYYLRDSGRMVTGRQYIDGTWYAFNEYGAWIP